MPVHEYTPADALEVLLERLNRFAPELEQRIRHAIDSGKDIQEKEPGSGRGKKKRVYRKHVAYSQEEALDIALAVLHAHFVEFPQIVNATVEAFRETRIGPTKKLQSTESDVSEWSYALPVPNELMGADKPTEIEIETETTQVKAQEQTRPVKRYEEPAIADVATQIDALRKLLTFTE
jgi:hypothetical protein